MASTPVSWPAVSTSGSAPTVSDVVAALERRFPPVWAEEWDRVGLVLGEPAAPVRRVLCVVDVVPETVDEALAADADMIVSHHPLLLRGVSSVAATTFKGRIIHQLIRAGMALYAAHTNADVASPGVSDALAARFGLTGLRPLQRPAPGSPAHGDDRGFGRIGELPQPMTLAELTRHAAAVLPVTSWGVRAAGDPGRMVRTLAVSGGSGDSFLGAATAAGVDAFLTADLRHHPASEQQERAVFEAGGGPPRPALVDLAHSASEWLWLPRAADALRADLAATGTTVETRVSTRRTDPWTGHVPQTSPPEGTT